MNQYGIGQPVRRVEDRRFLTGHGCYVDDLNLPRQAYAYMLRSPHAHADIRRIDTAAAPGDRARSGPSYRRHGGYDRRRERRRGPRRGRAG